MTPDTSLGFECIEFAEGVLGLALMPWQKWFLVHALELHPDEVDEHGDPVFRFRKVILLVGRQNGKSTVMQALTLWRMFIDRASLVLGTAQDLEVAEALWGESLEMALDIEELRAEIEAGGKIERQPGRKMFRLRSRETYKTKAASRRGGRGLSGELVLLDELREHQSWDAWSAVTKTTNAMSRAQVYGISNAGDATSLVLHYLRKKAHEELGDPDGLNTEVAPEDLLTDEVDEDDDVDSGLAIFEWSAAPGCDVMDRDAWAQANPALGHRVRESTLASDAKTDPEWVFRTEVLCQWSDGSLEGPFPPGSWEAGVDHDSRIAAGSPLVYGVDVSVDRTMSYIAVAGFREDGVPHVEVVAQRAGTQWVLSWFSDPDWLAENGGKFTVVGQSRGAPVSNLLKDLGELEGVEVVEWSGADLGNFTARLYDLVKGSGFVEQPPGPPVREGVCHLPQPSLDVAAATAVPRILTDGGMAWDRKKSPTDISPLVAVTAALGHLLEPADETPARSAYEDNDLLVI